MKKYIFSIVLILFWAGVIIYGRNYYPEKYEIQENESQLMGLKFMPPCDPLKMGVSCGYDMVFLVPFCLSLVIAFVIFQFDRKEENDTK